MPILWIIDDNLALLHCLELAFREEFMVRTFSEPIGCLRAFRKGKTGKPDVIIIDYEMAGMNGLELLGEILPGCPHIKAYLMSSALTAEIIGRAKQLGVKGWVGKPFDLGVMKELIRG